jgi:cyclophilin family peptidyl-prolyl cis-trans isomerase
MIQAGDPTGTGMHNCGNRVNDEFLPGLRFDRSGKLAIANTGAENSGGCQFFITVGPVSRWDGKYTIFGQIISGQKVVDEINKAAVVGDKPVHPVTIQTVKIRRISKKN